MKDSARRVLRPIGRRGRAGSALLLLLLPAGAWAAGGPIPVLTPSGRRELTPVTRGEVDRLPLDELIAGQGVAVATDARAGAATLQHGSHEVVLHHDKTLVSVDGDLKLLSAPVLFEAGRWLVPVDGLGRILPPLLDQPVQWRAADRVLVIGNVTVPRVAVSIYLSGDVARVVFEASEAVTFRVQQQENRVTVGVARDLVDAALPASRPAGGIVESVQFAGGRENQFTVALGPRFRTLKASEQESPPRLTLELHGPPLVGERGVPLPAPSRPPAAPAPRPTPSPTDAGVRTIVIDPGHGGEETGARGPAGTLEKDIALTIARKVRAELVNARGLSVFLTRDRDTDVPLDERTAIANNYKADLFVSVHVNASHAAGARGSEVYFLSYQASDEESRRIARLEGTAEPAAEVALILWDMAQSEHLAESSALASRVQEELAVVTASEGRGIKQAPFRVLVGATMPAILVEVAFISNPEEEKLLASEAYQTKVAGALARGIERYRREYAARLGLPLAHAEAPPPGR